MASLSVERVVQVLRSVYNDLDRRGNGRPVRLTRSQFNELAGRTDVRDSVFLAITRELRRKQTNLMLLRSPDGYVLVELGVHDKWTTPTAGEMARYKEAVCTVEAEEADEKHEAARLRSRVR